MCLCTYVCVYFCECTCVCIYSCVCTCVYITVCTFLCMPVCIDLCVCARVYILLCAHLCMHLHMYTCLCTCVCTYVCVYLYVHLCVCIAVCVLVCLSLCVHLCVYICMLLCHVYLRMHLLMCILLQHRSWNPGSGACWSMLGQCFPLSCTTYTQVSQKSHSLGLPTVAGRELRIIRKANFPVLKICSTHQIVLVKQFRIKLEPGLSHLYILSAFGFPRFLQASILPALSLWPSLPQHFALVQTPTMVSDLPLCP